VADRTLTVSITQDGPVPLDVAFTCSPGDVLGIYGPSGSGKTTILRTIAGLYGPRHARVAIGPERWLDTAEGISRPAHLRSVGFVFQEYALFPHMTALDNIRTALTHQPAAERRARAERLLEDVHLAEKRDRRPAELSGGERQRVALARALARDPSVLLLDEPFSAVDRSVRRRLQDLVDDLRRALDVPLVLVTHDFDDIVRLASHLLVLDHGRTVVTGSVRDVTSRPAVGWLADSAGLGTVFDATVLEVDVTRGLARLAFDGGILIAPDTSLTVGHRVRVRVPARDVILATEVPAGLSLHNALEATVATVTLDEQSRHAVVQVAVGGERILAEVTRDAVARLGIREGLTIHLLIKSVSLQVLPVTQLQAAGELGLPVPPATHRARG
jgi:molybdate transport system ATP-binding protein